MTSSRRVMTRQQVMRWRQQWSLNDQRFVDAALGVLPMEQTTIVEVQPGQIEAYVDGEKAFSIRPGFVSWPKGKWLGPIDASLVPGGLRVGHENDGTIWATLSCFRARDRRDLGGLERDFGTCDKCWTKITASGACAC